MIFTIKQLQQFATLLKVAIIKEMNSKGLSDSRIIKTVETQVVDNEISIIAADYLKYIESGRKPGVKRVPIAPLVQWIKRKNLKIPAGTSINQVAFAIQTAIFKRGIRARPILNPAFDSIIDSVLDLFDDTLDKNIEQELNKIFTHG